MKKIILSSFLVLTSLFFLSPSAQAALCKVGDHAQVLWGGKWWSARVIAVNNAGNKCKIHYKGYGSKWDEWVGANRIRISGKSTPSGSAPGTYAAGQRVKILWGSKWWNGRILKKKGNKYYISYDGYSSKWNEWVGKSRLRPR
ncbi:MAG: agenet domain-containing protein [bacterium]|nr:agenet domain-containing protein [bacterium]